MDLIVKCYQHALDKKKILLVCIKNNATDICKDIKICQHKTAKCILIDLSLVCEKVGKSSKSMQ